MVQEWSDTNSATSILSSAEFPVLKIVEIQSLQDAISICHFAVSEDTK